MNERPVERLAAVRRVRDLLERRALGRMAEGRRRVVEAEEHLRARRQAFAARPRTTVTSPAQLRADRLVGLGAHEAVVAATADVEVAAHQRDELEDEWVRAATERRSVERLAEHRASAASAAAERAAVRALDEMIAQRRGRR